VVVEQVSQFVANRVRRTERRVRDRANSDLVLVDSEVGHIARLRCLRAGHLLIELDVFIDLHDLVLIDALLL